MAQSRKKLAYNLLNEMVNVIKVASAMRLETEKKEKIMCKHKHLVFLGKQELLTEEKFIALFNCQDCRSTISLKMVKPIKKRRKAS